MKNQYSEIYGYCRLYGEFFSPLAVEKMTSIQFDRKNEPGELGEKGRYKGITIPFGYAEIIFSETGTSADIISPDARILDLIEKHQSSFREAGATEITIYITVFYKEQCNFEQSNILLKRLAKLGIDLLISCQQLKK